MEKKIKVSGKPLLNLIVKVIEKAKLLKLYQKIIIFHLFNLFI